MVEERRGQGEPESPKPPKFPRYEPSIRVIIVFFAAVLGFGLKHLLDMDIQDPVKAQKPVEAHTYKWLTVEPFKGLTVEPFKWLTVEPFPWLIVEPGKRLTVELYTYKWLFSWWLPSSS
jgi:hypothetical protein